MILVDNDSVDSTNCNRQLFATTQTVGQSKCLAAKERLLSIHPDLQLICHQQFFLPENSDFLFEQQPDLILDAIDTVTSKLYLAQQCSQRGIPLVSCLGTGNRLDPSLLRWGDISQTSGCGCPLARVMRRELKTRRPAADGRLFGGAACQNHRRRGRKRSAQPCQLRLCPAGCRLPAGKRRHPPAAGDDPLNYICL